MILNKVTNLNILFLLLIFISKFFSPISPDEAEHLHFSYLVFEKNIPYKDFWEHHMPLIWYLFSPINYGSNFFYKILTAKLIQSILILASGYLVSLNFPKKSRTLISFFFIIAVIIFDPWINYGDIRPELILFIIVPIIIIFISKKNIFNNNITEVIFIGTILSISFFFTPRTLPLIIISFFYILNKINKSCLAYFVITGIFISLIILFFFDLKNIIFFVFYQTTSLTYDFKPLFQIKKIFIILFYILILIFVLFKPNKKMIDYFYILSFLFIFLDKKPNIQNSTIILLIVSFVYFINYFYRFIINHQKFLIISIIIFGFFFKFFYFSKEDNRFNVSEYMKFYIKKNLDCKNRYFQGNSFRENFAKGKEQIHPIFVEDLTYFGFYQGAIIDKNISKIINYNKNKNITYIKNDRTTCFVDKSTLNKIIFYTQK